MKEMMKELKVGDKVYPICFNLNVMEVLQEKYGTLQNWMDSIEKKTKNKNEEISEPDVTALKFGFAEMINEAIDIQNEKNEIKQELVTLKQVGRIITEIGFTEMTGILTNTINESTQSVEKN